jgi:glycyl-tRNA synthetase
MEGKKTETGKELTVEELAAFCKRKGFVFRSSEIYGGMAGFWDFGPLGSELYNNIKRDFWKFFVQQKDNMVGIEASIISHPTTWRASGHLANFSDIAVVNKKTKQTMKLDKSEVDKFIKENPEWVAQGEFNLMFKTQVGALNPTDVYLRGETAQGMFMDFKLVQETSRQQLPFGIVQVGKCFRNEIAPRDFLFRSREFTIGEFEFFIHSEEFECPLLDAEHKNVKLRILDAQTQEADKDTLKNTTIGEMVKQKKLDEWHAYWLAEQLMWFTKLGLIEGIKVREHMKSELSHYSSATFDMDYEYPFGSKEIAGNANRGQYDLGQHAKESKISFELFDEKTKKKVVPRVIEPTFGMERVFLALLCNAYNYDEKRQNIVLKLPAYLAPIKAAVFPLISKGEVYDLSKEIFKDLVEDFNIQFDKSGSIGRRYSRQDEMGTPYCITVDEESLKGKDVTIRDRDTTKQIRVKISELHETLRKLIAGKVEFEKAGKLI